MKTLEHVYESKHFPDDSKPPGFSARALSLHHDGLYEGYVKKANEIQERLRALQQDVIAGRVPGDATYSELRGLKEGEGYAVNGIYLHEAYFGGLGDGADADPRRSAPELSSALAEQFHSAAEFVTFFSQCARAARGWTVLAWDTRIHRLAIYNGDSHNAGGIWGAIPIIVLDVYEHAYFMDFGTDKGAYIESFWKSFKWNVANDLYLKAQAIQL
jgi:Fe-Mn family superoxide dismutase